MPVALDPKNPLPFGQRDPRQSADEQRAEYELIGKLNRLAAVEYPQDDALRARIKAYELAFRMQMAVPEALDFKPESEATTKLYGLDADATKQAGQRLLDIHVGRQRRQLPAELRQPAGVVRARRDAAPRGAGG